MPETAQPDAASQPGGALPPEVEAFLAALDPPARQAEARALVAIFAEASGFEPRLWPGGILGFGRYAYRYDSGRSGESLATGFAPRKAEHVLYLNITAEPLLSGLGKVKAGKACIYLKRLSDTDPQALSAAIRFALTDLGTRWTIQPT